MRYQWGPRELHGWRAFWRALRCMWHGESVTETWEDADGYVLGCSWCPACGRKLRTPPWVFAAIHHGE